MQLITSILSFSQEKSNKHKYSKSQNEQKVAESLIKKQAMRLPIKVAIYLELFQHMLYDQISHDNFKFISQIEAFKRFSFEEKQLFLVQNIECMSDILYQNQIKNKQLKNFSHLEQQKLDKTDINNAQQTQLHIQTTAQINVSLMSKMKFGFWTSVKFRLNLIKQQVIISGKQNCIIQLQKYFVRKSKVNKNTLVLQAISLDLPSRFKKVSLSFKDEVFQMVYKNLWKCMIKNQKTKLQRLYNEDNFNKQKSNKQIQLDESQDFQINLDIGQFIFLTTYAIKQYFLQKQKIKKRLIKKFYDFKTIKVFNKQQSKAIDKRLKGLQIQKSNKRTSFYQSISEFSIPAQVLKFKFMDAFKQRNAYIFQWQILQKNDNGIQTLIQKYNIQGEQYNQLMIKEENTSEQELITLQCIGSLSQKVFIQFLIVTIEKINSQISILKIILLINKKKKALFHKISGQLQNKQHVSQNEVVIQFLKEFSAMISKKINKYQIFLQFAKELLLSIKLTPYNNGLQKIQQIHPSKENKQKEKEEQSQTFENQNLIFQGTLIQSSQNEKIYKQNKVVQQYLKHKQIFIQEHYLAEDWKRGPNGGLICINQEKIVKQKQILKKVLAQLGQNIIKQKNIMNISLPITIFKKQSQLKTIARNLSYAPLLFDIFYQQKGVDFLQRAKYATIFQISTNLASVNFQKPFNPILGQTMQLYINGCPFYLQQISHHPQISAFYFLGKGFKLYGYVQPKVSMGLNSCKAINDKFKHIIFDDGSHLQFGLNILKVHGTVFGDRMFNFQDKTFVYDKTNNLLSLITFGPRKKGLFQNSQQPLDYLFGKIWKMKKQFKDKYQKWKTNPSNPSNQFIFQELSSFQGIWNKQIYFDQQKYFDFQTILPHKIIEQSNPLPSNSSFRQDLQLLIKNNLDKAQQKKNKMEEQQRKDKKLRDLNKIN